MTRTSRAKRAGAAKVAISLPAPLHALADAYAHRLGLSRSELVARALTRYLQQADRSWITAAYDAAYDGASPAGGYGRDDDDTADFVRSSSAQALAALDAPSLRAGKRP
jgi:hypothetical protein